MNRKRNEQGIALASVLILTTLLALLAATILHLAYLSYERKSTEKRNNENFYCAEAVIDNIKTVVQNSVSVAIPKAEMSDTEFVQAAYTAITGNKNTVKVGESYSGAAIKKYLFGKVIADSNGDMRYDTNYYGTNDDGSKISTMVYNALTSTDASFNADGIANPDGNGGSFNIGQVVIESDGIRIEDVSIVYVNDLGYTSSITTDIVIRAPKYITASDAPLGSYSMFAGCGAVIYSVGASTEWALNNMLYLHQEGNGYFGSMTDKNSHNAIMIGSNGDNNAGGRGFSILSFDGTNIIFNGDVRIKNGGSLVFTGGDGTQTAQVQVNGYIVIEDGGSLFLAPNVKVSCKGIVTDITYNSDGTVQSYTPYTGTGAEDTVSQVYPLTIDAMTALDKTALQSYYENKIDVEQLFNKTGALKGYGDKTPLDARFYNVAHGGGAAGVYVLNTTSGTKGWNARNGCEYKKLTCSSGWVWKNTATSKTVSNIYCSTTDTNLDQIAKVYYNGEYYDAEYFNIVNVPLMLKTIGTNRADVNYSLGNYNICDTTTYATKKSGSKVTAKTWSDYQSTYSTVLSDFDWNNLKTLNFLTRDFYMPNSMVNIGSANYASTFTTTDGNEYKLSNSNFSFGPADNFSVTSGDLQFFVALKPITVRVTGGYSSGILLSAKKVAYGESTGAMRVVSLLELAQNCGSGTIEDEGNPVHEMLEKMGAGMITYNSSQYTFESNRELCLVDNMFNGGISAFWKMGQSSNAAAADNSNNDLIDVDKWEKN